MENELTMVTKMTLLMLLFCLLTWIKTASLLLLEAIKQDFGFRLSCDLFCMHLPQECFHEKDFLNHRYHAKRCLYLCVVEKNLRRSKFIGKVSWSTLQDEARKPVLHVYPGCLPTFLFFHIIGALLLKWHFCYYAPLSFF